MSVKSALSHAALGVLSHPKVGAMLARAVPDRLAVLMLHRFAVSRESTRGHSVNELRATLAQLRACGVRLLSLDEALQEYSSGASTRSGGRPAVAFTVDDGYRDFLSVALPAFEEFSCPVTCFVVPDVIDGKTWFWWDRLDFVLRRLPMESLELTVGDEQFEVRRSSSEFAWQRPLVAMLKRRSEEFRAEFLGALQERTGVCPPETVPDEYRVMTWDEIRNSELRGTRFGAHSMSHPVLSQCTPEDVRAQMIGSIERLRSEVRLPSTVFCYPYGLESDFGRREIDILRGYGINFAVSALPGRIDREVLQTSEVEDAHWRIPRFSFDGRRGMTLRQLLLS
ncbi:MAG: polysaccharide deacetylase family protein [Gemmatimonadaceae bacterium]|nr:polysaccharide deacetylase family protein [Gemmatimonadaceae bacterium]